MLFISACTLFYGNIGVSAEAGQTLGRGADHFAWIMSFQLAVLYAFVPIITAEAIAAEKQRDTLALLLVTTLTPRQIVLQKFAARTASILSFVCLSFPLLAITYTFGGVTPGELVLGMLGLIFSCLQLGALAILCSAYFRTTAQALAVTYVVFLILHYLTSDSFLAPPGVAGIVFAALTALVCLSMATGVLVDRAFVQSRNYLLEVFRALDRFFEQLNVVSGRIGARARPRVLAEAGSHPLARNAQEVARHVSISVSCSRRARIPDSNLHSIDSILAVFLESGGWRPRRHVLVVCSGLRRRRLSRCMQPA